MAKWGEGDPRWLVSSREDGRNVGGWHWTEKSYTAWTKERIGDLVRDLGPPLQPGAGTAQIVRLKRMDGEVTVSTRKGNKRFVQYDISLTLEWRGEAPLPLTSDVQTVTGEVRLGEFANDCDVDDYMFEVTVEGQGEGHERLKQAMRGMRGALVERLHQVLQELHELR